MPWPFFSRRRVIDERSSTARLPAGWHIRQSPEPEVRASPLDGGGERRLSRARRGARHGARSRERELESKRKERFSLSCTGAGIPEYWLVEARGDDLEFQIFRRGSGGYSGVRKQRGWLKSRVFGRSFRLSEGLDEAGNPEYSSSVH